MAKKMSEQQLEKIVSELSEEQKESFLGMVEDYLDVQLVPVRVLASNNNELENDDQEKEFDDIEPISELDLMQREDFLNIQILKQSMKLIDKLGIKGPEGIKAYFESAERLRMFLDKNNSNSH